MVLLCLAIGPSIALMAFFYLADRYEPEPRAHVLAAIALGALAMIPALAAVAAIGRAVDAVAGPDFLLMGGLGARAFEAFVLEGLVEEVLKWMPMVLVVYRWQEFDEPIDGIIYGVAVALGFGTVENVLYVTREGVAVGVLRALFAVPEHALLGSIMGGFLGSAKHGSDVTPRLRATRVAQSLVLPVLLHGSYNLLLLHLVGRWLYLGVGLGSVALWVVALGRLKRARDASPFKGGGPR